MKIQINLRASFTLSPLAGREPERGASILATFFSRRILSCAQIFPRACFLLFALTALLASAQSDQQPASLTPKPPPTPHINGPSIFGVRPGSPFLYHIPATGSRPMEFSVAKLPDGLKVNPANGEITGVLQKRGEYNVVLRAKNALGKNEKKIPHRRGR
jgi:hypothetical protein